MRLMCRLLLGTLVLILGAVLGVTLDKPVSAGHGPGWAQVVRFIDGDTVDVRTEAGAIERVRFFGYSTPELNERCGPEGTFALALHVNFFNDYLGWVYLEEGSRRIDAFGRSLYYGWIIWDGQLYILDLNMVRSGHALAWTQDGQWRAGIIAAEQEARNAGSGCLWAVSPSPSPGATAGGNCSPAYPTVCIQPPPPDLNCADIPYRRFPVLPPDPHGFDRDGDGIGCET